MASRPSTLSSARLLLWLNPNKPLKYASVSPSNAARRFSTSHGLRDASYADWTKTNTRDYDEISTKSDASTYTRPQFFSQKPFFPQLRYFDSAQSRSRTATASGAATPNAVGETAQSAQGCDSVALRNELTIKTGSLQPVPEVLAAEIEVVKLYQLGDYAQMYSEIAKYKAQGTTMPVSLLIEMASTLHEALPIDTSREDLHRCTVEAPHFYAEKQIRLLSLAAFASSPLKHLHQAFVLYELEYLENTKFLEKFIWLCYHTNDLDTLQRLFHKYLQKPLYDCATLSHITNAFVYNYDVEFAKNLFVSIIGMQKPLDDAYLSTTLLSFTHVKALYDNMLYIFQKWCSSDNCESPNPKTIALILKQSNLYGSASETAAVNDLVDRLGYQNNFFVRMVRSQTAIINRDNNRLKNITEDDFRDILEIRNGLGGARAALKAYYESYLHFFCTYSSMKSVQFILREMNKDGIRLTRFVYDSIATHYIATRKFVPLYKFIKKFLAETMIFEPIYAKFMFDGFLRAYPYHGNTLAHRMALWLEKHLSVEELQRLMESCRLKKLNSSLNPYALQSSDLSADLKYDPAEWKNIQYVPDQPALKMQRRRQMSYRAELGLKDILRKGISPDYSVIEDTLKNSGPTIRKGLLNALPGLRMTKYSLRLQIYDFILDRPEKHVFVDFVKKMEPKLNSSDRIFLARRALNKCDYSGCSLLLEGVNPLELTDSRHMIVLNLRLRNSVQSNDFAAFDDSIRKFPLNEITLSPFMLKQSRFVEKMLLKKIKAAKLSNHDTSIMAASLARLQGLIGDIEVRLEKDTKDIDQVMSDMFTMLTLWVETSKVRLSQQKTVLIEK